MGRFSPTITPTWGQSFGAALNGGVQSFLNTRRQKMEDELALYGHGLQPVDPNAPQAVAPMPTAGQVNQNIASNVGMPTSGPELAGALNGPPPQRGGIQQTPQVPAHMVAQALANHVQGGHSLTAPGTPLPSSEPAPIHLMGRDWRMTDQAKAQWQIALALKNAEIDAKSSEAFKNRREGQRLQPGDPGYVENEGAVAGARATAEVPAHVMTAVQTALGTLPIHEREMVLKGQIDLGTALAGIAARGKVEAGLQGNQQTFTAGENAKTRTAEATRQMTGLQGAFANNVAEAGATQGPVARLERKVLGAPPLPTSPQYPGAAPTAQQAPLAPQAAQLWDAAVKLHGRAKVLAEYGPRPQ